MRITRDDLDRLEREVARRANQIAASGRRALLGHPGNLDPEQAAAYMLSALAAMGDERATKGTRASWQEAMAA